MKKHVTVIPSRGRAKYFLRYNDLPIHRFQNEVFNTKLWIGEEEYEDYKKTLKTLNIDQVEIVVDDNSENIAECRQSILNYCSTNGYEYLFMPDDDQQYFSRELNFRRTPMDLQANKDLFNELCLICSKKYPLLSFKNRFMIQTSKVLYEKNYKIHCTYFIHVPTFIGENISFMYKNMKIYEDRIIQLLLNKKNYRTITSTVYALDQRHGNNAIGGCSSYRSIEEAHKCARIMQEDFPEVTSLFVKTNWSIGPRLTCNFFLKRFLDKEELRYVPKEEIKEFKLRDGAYGL